jgi:hypothetical protein
MEMKKVQIKYAEAEICQYGRQVSIEELKTMLMIGLK